MPVEERVHLRWIETGEVRHLFPMSFYPRSIQREDWKGGRSKHKAGYVMLRIPDHPRAGTSGYVFEHILVMERVLGRYVLPDESVHTETGFDTTIERRTSNSGSDRSPTESGSRMPSRGREKSWTGMVPAHLQQRSGARPERSWRWRESNPRP